jgi:hypothetical protein
VTPCQKPRPSLHAARARLPKCRASVPHLCNGASTERFSELLAPLLLSPLMSTPLLAMKHPGRPCISLPLSIKSAELLCLLPPLSKLFSIAISPGRVRRPSYVARRSSCPVIRTQPQPPRPFLLLAVEHVPSSAPSPTLDHPLPCSARTARGASPETCPNLSNLVVPCPLNPPCSSTFIPAQERKHKVEVNPEIFIF